MQVAPVSFVLAAPHAPRPRGPWCRACGHEYRSKDGVAESWRGACPYCGAGGGDVVLAPPFRETSKSAIELFELCEARYYFKRVLGLPDTKNKYAAFGINGHKMGEDYLRHGVVPVVNDLAPTSDASRAARSMLGGIPFAPPPGLPGLEVECEFHYDFEGVRYMGYKDYWAPLGPSTPGAPDKRRLTVTLLGDWKFTGDVHGRYVLTEESAIHDLQFTIEAWDDVRRGAHEVRGNWVYMLRGEKVGKPVRPVVRPAEVHARMRVVNNVARRALQMLYTPPQNPRDVATNGNACRKYGEPCPYLNVCHVTEAQKTFAGFLDLAPEHNNIGDTQMTMPTPGLDGLAAMVGAPNLTTAPPGFVPPPGPTSGAPAGFVPPPAQTAPQAPKTPPPASPSPQTFPVTINGQAYAVPAGNYRIVFNGQQHDVAAEQLAAAINAGASYLGPTPAQAPATPAPAATSPTAPPTQGHGAAINPTPPPVVPTLPGATAPTPPAATSTPRASRRSKGATTPAPGGIDYAAFADAFLDAIVDRLAK